MVAGRPRTTTPPPEELIKLGEELVKWAEEDTKDWRMRFCDWYSTIHGLIDKEWELMVAKEEFQGYYKRAQVALAKKWLNGSVVPSLAHRFIRIYCPEVREEEDKVASKANEGKIKELESFFSHLPKSDLKIDKTNAPKE